MKIIIAGGRDFKDYVQLCRVCDDILPEFENVSIFSGGANGADYLGERYAKENGYKVEVFPADWNKLGGKAGPIRNAQMAKRADGLIAFYDNSSRGTRSMIREATRMELMIVVAYY